MLPAKKMGRNDSRDADAGENGRVRAPVPCDLRQTDIKTSSVLK